MYFFKKQYNTLIFRENVVITYSRIVKEPWYFRFKSSVGLTGHTIYLVNDTTKKDRSYTQ